MRIGLIGLLFRILGRPGRFDPAQALKPGQPGLFLREQGVFGDVHHGTAVGFKGYPLRARVRKDGRGHDLLTVVDEHFDAEPVQDHPQADLSMIVGGLTAALVDAVPAGA